MASAFGRKAFNSGRKNVKLLVDAIDGLREKFNENEEEKEKLKKRQEQQKENFKSGLWQFQKHTYNDSDAGNSKNSGNDKWQENMHRSVLIKNAEKYFDSPMKFRGANVEVEKKKW